MALETPTGAVKLAPNRETRCLSGYLWIFAGEIENVKGDPAPGDILDILGHRGRWCGRGFFNPHSKIRVRILTLPEQRQAQEAQIDEDFWTERFRRAVELRSRLVTDTNAYRVVHAEGDLLPGLIVDR